MALVDRSAAVVVAAAVWFFYFKDATPAATTGALPAPAAMPDVG